VNSYDTKMTMTFTVLVFCVIPTVDTMTFAVLVICLLDYVSRCLGRPRPPVTNSL